MVLSVALNFRRPIYPPFYSFAKIFQTLSRDSPAFGSTKARRHQGRSHCPHHTRCPRPGGAAYDSFRVQTVGGSKTKIPTRGPVFQKIVLSPNFIGDRCSSDRFVDHHDGLARCAALFPAKVYATDSRGAHRREIKQQPHKHPKGVSGS